MTQKKKDMIYLICGNAGCKLRTVRLITTPCFTRLSKLHNIVRVDAARSDGHILLEVPPPPVGVHHNAQLEDQIDGEKEEEGQIEGLLGLHRDADLLESCA